MMFGHAPRTEKEKQFALAAYNIGMENPWASGRVAMSDGNFIVEDDRLNKKNWAIINSLQRLYAFFEHGNWCLGTGVIHKNLAFIQQDDGGDEWLTMKQWPDGEMFSFESVSFRGMILDWRNTRKSGITEFGKYIRRLSKATKEGARKLSY